LLAGLVGKRIHCLVSVGLVPLAVVVVVVTTCETMDSWCCE
jgi:hypothetical protein